MDHRSPFILKNGSRTRKYRALDNPRHWRNGLISRADVAEFPAAQIEGDTYVGKTTVLTN
jgi:hypothetical protein